MARRVYHVVDGLEETPSLRPKSPLARPLTRTVKGIAVFLGALSSIAGVTAGAGRWVLRAADIATNASVSSAMAGIVRQQQAEAAVNSERWNKLTASNADLSKKVEALTAALTKPKRKAARE